MSIGGVASPPSSVLTVSICLSTILNSFIHRWSSWRRKWASGQVLWYATLTLTWATIHCSFCSSNPIINDSFPVPAAQNEGIEKFIIWYKIEHAIFKAIIQRHGSTIPLGHDSSYLPLAPLLSLLQLSLLPSPSHTMTTTRRGSWSLRVVPWCSLWPPTSSPFLALHRGPIHYPKSVPYVV